MASTKRIRENSKFTKQHPELPINSKTKTASRKEYSRIKKQKKLAKK